MVRAPDGAPSAHLCRVEHIVGWVMRGAQWQLERPWEFEPEDRVAGGMVELERHRSGTTSTEAFESAEALRAWASKGGPWART